MMDTFWWGFFFATLLPRTTTPRQKVVKSVKLLAKNTGVTFESSLFPPFQSVDVFSRFKRTARTGGKRFCKEENPINRVSSSVSLPFSMLHRCFVRCPKAGKPLVKRIPLAWCKALLFTPLPLLR